SCLRDWERNPLGVALLPADRGGDGLSGGAGPVVEAGFEAAVAHEVRVGRTGGRRQHGRAGRGEGRDGEQREQGATGEGSGAFHKCLRTWGRWGGWSAPNL